MDSILHPDPLVLRRLRHTTTATTSFAHQLPCTLISPPARKLLSLSTVSTSPRRHSLVAANGTLTANSVPKWHWVATLYYFQNLPTERTRSQLMQNLEPRSGVYTVGDFMTKKEDLCVVKPTTTVDEALEILVEHRITGFPVIDEDWKLVGLVSDYDLLALDSISGGGGKTENNMFPEVDSTWKTFIEVQKLLSKTNGKVVGDLMTPAPLVVRESTNLEDAARLLLETKYRRLPVVDADGKLVGIITRGNVVRAALHIKRMIENKE